MLNATAMVGVAKHMRTRSYHNSAQARMNAAIAAPLRGTPPTTSVASNCGSGESNVPAASSGKAVLTAGAAVGIRLTSSICDSAGAVTVLRQYGQDTAFSDHSASTSMGCEQDAQ